MPKDARIQVQPVATIYACRAMCNACCKLFWNRSTVMKPYSATVHILLCWPNSYLVIALLRKHRCYAVDYHICTAKAMWLGETQQWLCMFGTVKHCMQYNTCLWGHPILWQSVYCHIGHFNATASYLLSLSGTCSVVQTKWANTFRVLQRKCQLLKSFDIRWKCRHKLEQLYMIRADVCFKLVHLHITCEFLACSHT